MESTESTINVAVKYNADMRLRQSESITKLAAALAKAQGQMENADKDGKGTYGKYATLAATWDAIRKPFSDNELAVYQRILTIKDKPTMATMLIHSSGEFMDDCELELKFDTSGRMNAMQAMGSAVTYARRYSLQAVSGVAPADDDDGVSSGDPQPKPAPKNFAPKPAQQPPPQMNIEDKIDPQPKYDETPEEKLASDLFDIVIKKNIPQSEMPGIIFRVTGEQKKSKELSAEQLTKVIDYILLLNKG